jgi:hypothetical protein
MHTNTTIPLAILLVSWVRTPMDRWWQLEVILINLPWVVDLS